MDKDKPGIGLRERKKSEMRDALSWAAVRLAVERGLNNVLVEDIAAATDVSPRTFNNYFSSKAEAIVARHSDRMHAIVRALRARPRAEPIWEAIRASVIAQFCGELEDAPPDERWAAGVKVMLAEPAVQAQLLRESRVIEREIAVVIADRISADLAGFYSQLVAAAVGATVQVSLEQWLRADPPMSLRQILGIAFERMARIADFPPHAVAVPSHLFEEKL